MKLDYSHFQLFTHTHIGPLDGRSVRIRICMWMKYDQFKYLTTGQSTNIPKSLIVSLFISNSLDLEILKSILPISGCRSSTDRLFSFFQLKMPVVKHTAVDNLLLFFFLSIKFCCISVWSEFIVYSSLTKKSLQNFGIFKPKPFIRQPKSTEANLERASYN